MSAQDAEIIIQVSGQCAEKLYGARARLDWSAAHKTRNGIKSDGDSIRGLVKCWHIRESEKILRKNWSALWYIADALLDGLARRDACFLGERNRRLRAVLNGAFAGSEISFG